MDTRWRDDNAVFSHSPSANSSLPTSRACAVHGVSQLLALATTLALLASGCASTPSQQGQFPSLSGSADKKRSIPASIYLEKPVATINGVPLTVREYRRHLAANRTMVLRDIIANHEVPDPAHFWTTPIDGQTPWERLRDQALGHAIEFRLEQMLACERGVLADISYPAFLMRMNQENRLRAGLRQQNRPPPGPRRFTEEEYYFYGQRQIEVALIRVLADADLAVTDEEVRRFYEANKARLYSRSTSQVDNPDDPFERIREVVRLNLVEEKYHAWLDDLKDRAVVVTDDLALDEQMGMVTADASRKSRK
jgi:hypothetical protein